VLGLLLAENGVSIRCAQNMQKYAFVNTIKARQVKDSAPLIESWEGLDILAKAGEESGKDSARRG
jgi:hypothetical protein